MVRRLSHAELQDLLGAYALDAVDGEEAEAVALHLAACPRCRAEVAQHREVAAFLGHSGERAPDGLWDRIVGALEERPPGLALAPVVSLERPGSRRRRWGMRTAAAVAAAVIGVLGVQVADLRDRVRDAETALGGDALAGAVLAAEAHPEARTARLVSGDGGARARAILLPDGRGYLVAEALPRLPPGRTYQLWALAGGTAVSAGVLGAAPEVVAFHVAPARVEALALTEEDEPGVARSANPPALAGRLA